MAVGTAGAPSSEADSIRAGFISGVTAYVLWGFSVIFYKWLAHVPASEVIAHRIVWTVFFVGLFLVAFGRLNEVLLALRDRRVLLRLLLSASIIGINWLVFVWAIAQNQVLAVSFGYFINPLVSVMIGFLLLGERLSTGQRVAIGLAVVAIVIQATTLHGFPWISLFLACSFAAYGYVRKLTPVGASPGLFIETSLILPLGIAYVVWLEATGTGHFTDSPVDVALLLGTGIVTSLPLILFAFAARRLTLTVVGLLQYLAPSIQFALAVLVYGEPLSAERFASFALIWVALAVFSIASLRKKRPPEPVKTV
ncbi:EamA family transporter RarD [Rhodobium orientis]|uniref:EamA family transporter RarD n=1 Tax=Rhodobium orientis TaxID=34017 RepID=UPI0019144701|nr:EamA family transporter RarD [Rhodobium orientis]